MPSSAPDRRLLINKSTFQYIYTRVESTRESTVELGGKKVIFFARLLLDFAFFLSLFARSSIIFAWLHANRSNSLKTRRVSRGMRRCSIFGG